MTLDAPKMIATFGDKLGTLDQIPANVGYFQRGHEGRVRRQVAGQVRVGRLLRLLHRRWSQGGLPRVLRRLLTESVRSPSSSTYLRRIQCHFNSMTMDAPKMLVRNICQ